MRESHPMAGKTVYLNSVAQDPVQGMVVPAAKYTVEDWWQNLTGRSWMNENGNPACLQYAMRSAGYLPLDDDVVYGKTENGLGHLVHVSELGEEVTD